MIWAVTHGCVYQDVNPPLNEYGEAQIAELVPKVERPWDLVIVGTGRRHRDTCLALKVGLERARFSPLLGSADMRTGDPGTKDLAVLLADGTTIPIVDYVGPASDGVDLWMWLESLGTGNILLVTDPEFLNGIDRARAPASRSTIYVVDRATHMVTRNQ